MNWEISNTTRKYVSETTTLLIKDRRHGEGRGSSRKVPHRNERDEVDLGRVSSTTAGGGWLEMGV